MMDTSDWDSVLQFTDPIEVDYGLHSRHNRPYTLQAPTPPESHDGTPSIEHEESSDGQTTLVSVSTTFYPGSNNDPLPPDLILLSADSVFFYVHLHILTEASDNGFRSLLPPPPTKGKDASLSPVIPLSESSTVLNIILHCIYDMSCAQYSPTFDVLTAAVSALPTYGVQPRSRILPGTPLSTLLLSHAPLRPLDLYALAATHDLYDMAVSTSSHLLSFSLATLTDDMAERIGPVYLKRLFFLHFGRVDALKRLLLPPPHPHAPTARCDFVEQKKLTRAWTLASAYLAWDARPDLSTSTMESALNPLEEHLTCDLCRQSLKERVKNLVVQWSVVKRTI